MVSDCKREGDYTGYRGIVLTSLSETSISRPWTYSLYPTAFSCFRVSFHFQGPFSLAWAVPYLLDSMEASGLLAILLVGLANGGLLGSKVCHYRNLCVWD